MDVGAPVRERDKLERVLQAASCSTLTYGKVASAPSVLDYHGYNQA